MKINSKKLGKAVRTLWPIIKKTSLSILDNYHVFGSGKTLFVEASNIDTSAIIKITDVELDCDVNLCINAANLGTYLNQLPDEDIEITFSTPNVVIKHSGGYTSIPSVEGSQFPVFESGGTLINRMVLPCDYIVTAATQALVAPQKDDYRPQLQSVFFDTVDGVLSIVSTDTHILYAANVDAPSNDASFLLSVATVTGIVKVLKDVVGDLTIEQFSNFTRFVTSDIVLEVKAMEGRFPAWRRVLKRGGNVVTFDRQSMADALARVSAFADKGAVLSVEILADTIVLSTKNSLLSTITQETVTTSHNDVQATIYFNVERFIDAVDTFVLSNLRLFYDNSNKPVVFMAEGDESKQILLMPVQG